jgi:hypothetical protein
VLSAQSIGKYHRQKKDCCLAGRLAFPRRFIVYLLGVVASRTGSFPMN